MYLEMLIKYLYFETEGVLVYIYVCPYLNLYICL
jgi:hypothetical protein